MKMRILQHSWCQLVDMLTLHFMPVTVGDLHSKSMALRLNSKDEFVTADLLTTPLLTSPAFLVPYLQLGATAMAHAQADDRPLSPAFQGSNTTSAGHD